MTDFDVSLIVVTVITALIGEVVILFFARARGWTLSSIKIMRNVVSLHKRLSDYGVTNFYSSREDYVKYRGAATIPDFLSKARKTIQIAGIWLAEGVEIQGVTSKITELVRAPRNVEVTISLVNPKGPAVTPLASYLGMDESEVKTRILTSLIRLDEIKENLGPTEKNRLKIKVYNTLPVMSIILIDAETEFGVAQIDIKPYKASRALSFGLQIQGKEKPLFTRIVSACDQLFVDSEVFESANFTGVA